MGWGATQSGRARYKWSKGGMRNGGLMLGKEKEISTEERGRGVE